MLATSGGVGTLDRESEQGCLQRPVQWQQRTSYQDRSGLAVNWVSDKAIVLAHSEVDGPGNDRTFPPLPIHLTIPAVGSHDVLDAAWYGM